jgi:hypothetical protein
MFSRSEICPLLATDGFDFDNFFYYATSKFFSPDLAAADNIYLQQAIYFSTIFVYNG